MPVLTNRPCLVSFRLSEEEYDRLVEVCKVSGSRSVSDYARSAVIHRLTTHNGGASILIDDLKTLSEELVELDVSLANVRTRISRVVKSKA